MLKFLTFSPDNPKGIQEYFISGVSDKKPDFKSELTSILEEYLSMFNRLPSGTFPLLFRLHLSDPANQKMVLKEVFAFLHLEIPELSIVGQAPANGSRVALEVWLWSRKSKNYRVEFLASPQLEKSDSYTQMQQLFAKLHERLRSTRCNLEKNVDRTWIYCRDIDNNYAGLVKARNDYFDICRLTPDNHFIASTGIEGCSSEPCQLVQMDALVWQKVKQEQKKYLKAEDHLSNTAIYGVRFERGTALTFGDRRHAYISGTASINAKGKILYPGDVTRQAKRIVENIKALLAEAEMTLRNLTMLTVYLRDNADYDIVKSCIIRAGFPERVPMVILRAPVCRPGWLVEVEALAAKGICSDYPVL